ncbi:MAG: hypothetical protein AAGA66_19340, partial [Bacteroidota bacterium]
LIFICSLLSMVHAQERNCGSFLKASLKNGEKLSGYLSKRLVFEKEAARSKTTGQLVIDFRINRLGRIDSINVIEFPHESLAKQAVDVLLTTKNSWQATTCDSSTIDHVYKIVIEYVWKSGDEKYVDPVVRIKKKVDKAMKKEAYQKAMEWINSAIALDEYDPSLFRRRAKIFERLDDSASAKTDIETSKRLKNMLLIKKLLITGYTTIRRVEVSRTRF